MFSGDKWFVFWIGSKDASATEMMAPVRRCRYPTETLHNNNDSQISVLGRAMAQTQTQTQVTVYTTFKDTYVAKILADWKNKSDILKTSKIILETFCNVVLNSMWPSDAIWLHISGSTFAYDELSAVVFVWRLFPERYLSRQPPKLVW